MKKLIIAAAISLASFGANAKSCVMVVTNAYNHTIRDYNGDPSVVKSLEALSLYMKTCEQAKDARAANFGRDKWVARVKEIGEKYARKGLIHPDVYYTNTIIADIAYGD